MGISHPLCGTLQNESDAYRKMRLRVEDVQGRNCLTNFWVSAAGRDCSGLTGGRGRVLLCLVPCVAVKLPTEGLPLPVWTAVTLESRKEALLSAASQWQHLLDTCRGQPACLCDGHDLLGSSICASVAILAPLV